MVAESPRRRKCIPRCQDSPSRLPIFRSLDSTLKVASRFSFESDVTRRSSTYVVTIICEPSGKSLVNRHCSYGLLDCNVLFNII
jgi:hypothetical protein